MGSPVWRYRERLSFDPTSIIFLVKMTNPKICVHSETMLPTTWPHLLSGSMARNATTQAIPVINRKMLSECSRNICITLDGKTPFGCLLSAEPFS